MKTPPTSSDPRVKRTRQLLLQAFGELMQEKGFSAISIQDITARATVNRGTFYAHFPDKLALLDAFTREQFQHAVASKLPSTSRLGRTTLRLLIQTVVEYLSKLYNHCQPFDIMNPFLHPFLQQAVQEELTKLLLTWLKQERGSKRVSVETMAVTTS
jgi:AcrR family transcriptional regulator